MYIKRLSGRQRGTDQYQGGGGIMQARISAIQILYEIFVHDMFGVFKDLCRYALGIASAHCFS